MKRNLLFLLLIIPALILNAQTTIWSTDFESLDGLASMDLDGDGFEWFQNSDGTLMGFAPGKYMGSYSVNTSPDNVITAPVFNIPAAASNLTFSLRVASSSSASYSESYAVYIQEDGVGSMFDNELYQGILTSGGPDSSILINGSIPNSFAGKNVRIIVRHFNTTNQLLFMIDDLKVESGDTLSVENSNFDNFSFYPNPVNYRLNFNSNQPISKIQIFNILGQEVLRFNASNIFNNSVELNNLNSGNYLIKVFIENTSQVFRLVKI